jgi:hypothetical protein
MLEVPVRRSPERTFEAPTEPAGQPAARRPVVNLPADNRTVGKRTNSAGVSFRMLAPFPRNRR